ncbi:MAG: hypothetical protein B7733_23800 [Myxococcales bacterium FL481]|nr:MAG: hypothetical protein B7733_23800 [Myxococcales bacterium FL481]
MKSLLVADTYNHTLRHVTVQNGLVRTILGVPGVPGSGPEHLRLPASVVVAARSHRPRYQIAFVSDTGNQSIRVINLLSGQQATVGAEQGVLLESPRGLSLGRIHESGCDPGRSCVEDVHAAIYVADAGDSVIRKFVWQWRGEEFSPDVSAGELLGEVETFGQPGVPGANDPELLAHAEEAHFSRPEGVLFHRPTNRVYVADTGNQTVRYLDVSDPDNVMVGTLAGRPGEYGVGHQCEDLACTLDSARFGQPVGLALLTSTTLLVSDRATHLVRRIALDAAAPEPRVSPYLGVAWEHEGSDERPRLRAPSALSVDARGRERMLYIADTGHHGVRRVVERHDDEGAANVVVDTLAGPMFDDPVDQGPGHQDGWPHGFSLGDPTNLACGEGVLYLDGVGLQAAAVDGNVAHVRVLSSWEHGRKMAWSDGVVYTTSVYSTHAANTDSDNGPLGQRFPAFQFLGVPGAFRDQIAVHNGVVYLEFVEDHDDDTRLLAGQLDGSDQFVRIRSPQQRAIWAADDHYLYSGSLAKRGISPGSSWFHVDVTFPPTGSSGAGAPVLYNGYAYQVLSNSEGPDVVRFASDATQATSVVAESVLGGPTEPSAFETPMSACEMNDKLYVLDRGGATDTETTGGPRVQEIDLLAPESGPITLSFVRARG